jgi:predicted nucleotidyltransferase component of viral defense system
MSNETSIRARLLNISKKEGVSFQLILMRYLHERFLYRLSISKYVNNFFLKGGNFIYAIQGLSARPTKDIDLLGKDVANDIESLKKKIAEILSVDCADDFVWFNHEEIKTKPIVEKNLYNGVRVILEAGFDSIRQQLQIDIGFGDIIIPKPINLEYPTLLPEIPAPIIVAYTPETVIAEKFQAMVELATLNSRMKDFYDVYILLTEQPIDKDVLRQAILNTFENRNTALHNNHSLFTDDFKNSPQRLIMWKAFLKKINIQQDLPFQNVLETIIEHIRPLLIENEINKY